jgi:hypothetical protein
VSWLSRHGLISRDLHEKFFQRRVFKANLAQRPAVLDNGSGRLFADVVAVLGPQRSRNKL